MLKVLILGATGGTGRHATVEAVARGYDVTVYVRDSGRVPTTAAPERLTVVTGAVEDPAALARAMRGQGVVVSALGRGSSLRSGGLIARAVPAIVGAMEQQGIKRLIFTSAYGVGETYRDVPLIPRLFIRTLLADLYRDKTAGEEILHRSSLDWTLVYPVTLTNGPRRGHWRAGERLSLSGLPRISRADVGSFLVSQIDDTTYIRKGVLVGS